jgi:ParB family chromosome partitioning protein
MTQGGWPRGAWRNSLEKRLGRGLSSLLSQPTPMEGPTEVSVDRIRPNPHQPRKEFEESSLDELAASIKSHGLLQPVLVRSSGSGYELISGERRWRAAKKAGLRTLPAVVRADVSDEDMLELALVENVQRQDLDAIERAHGFAQMMTQLGLTQEQVAEKVGLQRATVTNHIRLLELPAEIQQAIGKGAVTMGHARAILGIAEEPRRLELLRRIVREDLSVRRTEEIVREQRRPQAPSSSTRAAPRAAPPWATDLEKRFRRRLGTKVTLNPGPGDKGQIAIEYYSRSDLERLCDILAPKDSL